MKFALVMFAIWLAVGITGASAASITKHGDVVYYTGDVTDGDAMHLLGVLETGDTIIVKSPGGVATESVKIGKVLRYVGKITVQVNGICASACANFALAADRKLGRFGFHLARFPEHVETNAQTKEIEAQVNEEIINELWIPNLTATQIKRIALYESRTEMVWFNGEEL